MRVVVNIPPGSHPELLKEFENTPPRERAERLRMLATFGLIHMGQPVSRSIPRELEDDKSEAVQTKPLAQKEESRKQSLKSKLGLGL